MPLGPRPLTGKGFPGQFVTKVLLGLALSIQGHDQLMDSGKTGLTEITFTTSGTAFHATFGNAGLVNECERLLWKGRAIWGRATIAWMHATKPTDDSLHGIAQTHQQVGGCLKNQGMMILLVCIGRPSIAIGSRSSST